MNRQIIIPVVGLATALGCSEVWVIEGGKEAVKAAVPVDAGTAAPQQCAPGSQQDCYPGPAGTLGVGVCSAGTQTCLASGAGYGACEGAVVPSTEICSTALDEDCDGDATICTGLPDWGQNIGDAWNDMGYSVATDAAANAYVAGNTDGADTGNAAVLI